MDSMVLRAMAKWPNVPALYGWLSLDRRGTWRLRGEPIGHRSAVEFIGRNYGADERGRWYFQNGPQRVFVTLEYTPWVFVLEGSGAVLTHTGAPIAPVTAAFLDEQGSLLLGTRAGVGIVCDRDLASVSERLVGNDALLTDEALLRGVGPTNLTLQWAGRSLPVGLIRRAEVSKRFGFDPQPSAD
jgi:hypothetical protein